MTGTISYEWAALELDEAGDIVETSAYPTLCAARRATATWAAIAPGEMRYAIELVRNQITCERGVVSRTWARINERGRLPWNFQNGQHVPQRFRKECERTLECSA
jgi:hypothetical protein